MKSPASAVVSGLPLVTKPMLTRLKLVRDAFLALAPGAPLRAVHLFGGAPDPEVAAGRVHRGLGADLDEPSARAGLGVSQGLKRASRHRAGASPNRDVLNVRAENPRDPGIASIRLAQCEAGRRAGARRSRSSGADVSRISLGDFPLPIYDGDLQARSGVPQHAVNLKRMIGAHHGVLIVTPEYNSSVPALVKNTIDWVSRVQDPHETRGQVFRERVFAIAVGVRQPARRHARAGGAAADPVGLPRERDPEPARAVIRRAWPMTIWIA